MAATWCPDCRAFMADGTTCHECRRRRAWGTVNRAIFELLDFRKTTRGVQGFESLNADFSVLTELEAVAMLMQERQALLHQHRRDMRDEQRAVQRGSSEAFDDGRDAGRRERTGGLVKDQVLSTPQYDLLEHLRKFGPSWPGAFHGRVVNGLLRRGLVTLDPEGRLVAAAKEPTK
jgi:hypothetical protein